MTINYIKQLVESLEKSLWRGRDIGFEFIIHTANTPNFILPKRKLTKQNLHTLEYNYSERVLIFKEDKGTVVSKYIINTDHITNIVVNCYYTGKQEENESFGINKSIN